ncbi:hypothetical protein HHK36_009499 [Tetracentron sinense]|uniref:Thioredoxin domain-containing protein n=1 Tax=Tetracentron sinense TaxID=13715 RepID=A0A835DL28_TETSI|nr:hypothetical protein HHK36_009499 [Tetracentron sinense]
MATRVWETGILLFLVFGRLTCGESARVSSLPVCPAASITDSIFSFRGLGADSNCPLDGGGSVDLIGVTEEVIDDMPDLNSNLQSGLEGLGKDFGIDCEKEKVPFLHCEVVILCSSIVVNLKGLRRAGLVVWSPFSRSLYDWEVQDSVNLMTLLESVRIVESARDHWVWDTSSNGRFSVKAYLQGDEVSLHSALNLVHKNSHEYVSMLFYASWCPFSRTCRPAFTILSSLYPSIRHFAIEESAIRPSILSRYGVHGFPTLFLLNSTTQERYHGSRSLNSLITFYSDVTGIKPVSLDRAFDKTPLNLVKLENIEQESCPFSWARSPENLLRQETYLALATAFVLLRLLHFLLPTLLSCARCAWSRHIRNVSFVSLWEHPLGFLNRAMQVFNALKEPCKKTNLQEGALNATAWASKSLASVSIGDASSSRGCLGSERQ